MATLDKIAEDKKGKKSKKKEGMANAVSSTEKIRQWVCQLLFNFNLFYLDGSYYRSRGSRKAIRDCD